MRPARHVAQGYQYMSQNTCTNKGSTNPAYQLQFTDDCNGNVVVTGFTGMPTGARKLMGGGEPRKLMRTGEPRA